jgi:glutamate synthase domain-containing protein 3
MVGLEPLDEDDAKLVHDLIRRHYDLTESALAWRLLSGWKDVAKKFVKVMPVEYRKILAAQHLDSDAAKLASV